MRPRRCLFTLTVLFLLVAGGHFVLSPMVRNRGSAVTGSEGPEN